MKFYYSYSLIQCTYTVLKSTIDSRIVYSTVSTIYYQIPTMQRYTIVFYQCPVKCPYTSTYTIPVPMKKYSLEIMLQKTYIKKCLRLRYSEITENLRYVYVHKYMHTEYSTDLSWALSGTSLIISTNNMLTSKFSEFTVAKKLLARHKIAKISKSIQLLHC